MEDCACWDIGLHEERMRHMLLLYHRPVPRRKQRRHVCHGTCCCLKIRPPPPNSDSSTPACMPLRPRLETGAVLGVRQAAIAALRGRVARAAAPAAPEPEPVVVQLVFARTTCGAVAAHGNVRVAAAGTARHPAAHLLRFKLPPPMRAVTVLAYAARGRSHVVAITSCNETDMLKTTGDHGSVQCSTTAPEELRQVTKSLSW